MSEYLNKKAVLEWAKQVIEANQGIKGLVEGVPDQYPLYFKSIGKIQCMDALLHQAESGTFNADESEPDEYESMALLDMYNQIRRLRAALLDVSLLVEDLANSEKDEFERLRENAMAMVKMIHSVLIKTEPKGASANE